MPALAELQARFSQPTGAARDAKEEEEMLVRDARSTLSPAQVVEQKLRSALHGGALARAGLMTAAGKRRGAK